MDDIFLSFKASACGSAGEKGCGLFKSKNMTDKKIKNTNEMQLFFLVFFPKGLINCS